MEKYRPYADPSTGVNPFVPAWSNYKTSLVGKLFKVLFLPIALLRVAFFSLAVLWLALAQLVCMLIPVGFLCYPVHCVLTYVGCNIALLAVGVIPWGEALADHRRLKLLPPKTNNSRVFDAKRGTLVVANQQGLTDVLFLGMKLFPSSFVFAASDGSAVEYSLLGALTRAGARRPASAGASTSTLAAIADRANKGFRGPVVVFPEGSRTNGSCVLAWKAKTFEGLEALDKPVGTAVVSVEYSKTGAYTPHHTVGTSFRHVFWLAMQPWHTVKAVWLPSAEIATAMKGKPFAEQTALLRTVLARMLPNSVEVEVQSGKHFEFMAFWDAAQRKGYTKGPVKGKKA